jgi:hypothetical protein
MVPPVRHFTRQTYALRQWSSCLKEPSACPNCIGSAGGFFQLFGMGVLFPFVDIPLAQ